MSAEVTSRSRGSGTTGRGERGAATGRAGHGRRVSESLLELPGEIVADPDKTARVAALVAAGSTGRVRRGQHRQGARAARGRTRARSGRPASAPSRPHRRGLGGARQRRSTGRPGREGLAAAQEVADAKAQPPRWKRRRGPQPSACGPSTSARRALAGSLLEIRAPIAGTVVARDAVVGQMTDPEHPIATVVDLGEVWFLGRVFEERSGPRPGQHLGWRSSSTRSP